MVSAMHVMRDGIRTSIEPTEAIDLVFNGELFHGDRHKAGQLKDMIGDWRLALAAELLRSHGRQACPPM
jgi:hypothetical protein